MPWDHAFVEHVSLLFTFSYVLIIEAEDAFSRNFSKFFATRLKRLTAGGETTLTWALKMIKSRTFYIGEEGETDTALVAGAVTLGPGVRNCNHISRCDDAAKDLSRSRGGTGPHES